MRCFYTLTACTLIGAHVALGASGGVLVLCVGSDGHVALEQACERSCAGTNPPFSREIAEASCCGPCTDIGISQGESNPWGSRVGSEHVYKFGPSVPCFVLARPDCRGLSFTPIREPPALLPSARRVVFLI